MSSVDIVLVRPVHPGNVGSVARAMKNLGFKKLSIISDQDPRTKPECFWMADHAQDILEQASVSASLDDALKPVALVVGTTSRRGARWSEAIEPEGLVDLLARGWQGRSVAVVFGPEDRGLSVKELSRCRWVLRIPTREDYPSMNLSHAVCVICYVLARGPAGPPVRQRRTARVGQVDNRHFLDEVEGFLRRTGFFGEDPARTHSIMRRIEGLLVRAAPSRSDSAMLWAVLRHLQRRWSGPVGLDED